MVFCRECNRKVDNCEHFVAPLGIPAISVFDPKIKTVAYKTDSRTLEIAFKDGQVWQLFGVPLDICEALLQQTLSAFLKFVAHRYKAAPVRTPPTSKEPQPQLCPVCNRPMIESHRTTGGTLRVLWHCAPCNESFWHSYSMDSVPERKQRRY